MTDYTPKHLSSRTVGRVTVDLMQKLDPSMFREFDKSVLQEAKRRFPYCDLRVWMNPMTNCYQIEAGGYIEGEDVQKRDSLPCPQA